MKKKILIRIGSLRHGGAEKVLVTFLKNLSPEKYEIDLLLNLYSGKYLKDVPSWINIYYLNKGEMITTNRLQDIPQKAFRVTYQGLLKKFPKLLYKFILQNKKYDIEFAAIHTISDEILNSPIKSSKKIVWIHNDLKSIDEFSDDYIRKLFEFDKILVISSKIEQDFIQIAQSENERSRIVKIHNPIDTQEIIDLSKESIKFESNKDVKKFFSIGTNLQQKGYDRLVEIHKSILDKGLFHQIYIIGENSERLKKMIIDKNVQDTFILLGYIKNPYPYFKYFDFYIMSSRFEGYPTVLFEALVLNKYIITTDVSGASDIIINDQAGKIVNNSNQDLQIGMEELLNLDFTKTIENSISYKLVDAVNSIESVLNE